MHSPDLIWTLVGFFLTLMIFSYIFGDNPLFRAATYLFVGVAAGYTAVLVLDQVLLPKLLMPLLQGTLNARLLILVPLLLSLLLLGKLTKRLSNLGNVSMAYIVGAGAAVAIGGAVMGTLFTQVQATAAPFNLKQVAAAGGTLGTVMEGVLVLIGTIATLAYFHFSVQIKPGQSPERPAWLKTAAKVGEVFIGITLGALLAGVFASSFTALVERLSTLVDTILRLFS